ncbi:hypothetical protein CAPTEDRAFT_139106, partial [Capitella teleta]
MTTTDEQEICNIIKSLKSRPSSGYDYISTNHLKQLSPLIAHPLSILYNRCITQGYFPHELKAAKVIPIHKKDDTRILNNYRPIALLPSLSKILEKLIAKRI